jgi:hypothetical protein
VETHATELARLWGDLDLETRSYTEYRQNVRHRSVNFTKSWLRHLTRFTRGVCPSLARARNSHFIN